MSNDRKVQLMQEALDQTLSLRNQQELSVLLDEDPANAAQYSKLEQAEIMLQNAGNQSVRAPERLALTIMARIAQSVMEMEGSQREEQSEITEATMRVALSMVVVATLPLMMGASWLLINAHSNPEAIEAVLEQVAALFLFIVDVMKVMLDEAEALFKSHPEAAMALLALMPVTLLILVKKLLGIDEDEDEESP